MSCVDEFFRQVEAEADVKKSGVMIARGSDDHARPKNESPCILKGEYVPVQGSRYIYIQFGVMLDSK